MNQDGEHDDSRETLSPPTPPAAAPAFDYSLDFATIDFRAHPELYRVGKGEQGVLLVQPYKSELLPHWRFRTPEIARDSADTLYTRFLAYKAEGDFVGMDMARKFLQMGFTRARRYANHKSGRKWSPGKKEVLPRDEDPTKAESARTFYERYVQARDDPDYQRLKQEHIARFAPKGS
ncbi:MAG: DUF4385 domain-containing protein [Thermomicrobiales bacterium]